MQDPHHNEAARQRAGADEPAFLKRCLLPALAAALLLSLYLVMRGPKLADWGLFKAAWVSMLAGIGIYALAWIFAWPPKTWVPCRDEETGAIVETRELKYWLRDFAAWLGAGAVYGVMIGLGVHIVAKYLPWVMIGNAFVDHTTAVFLLAFIYGIPWIVSAQLTAEMVFVGLTSWQPYSDSDREWFGRSTGWFAAAAFLWFAASFLVLIAGETLWYLIRQYDSVKYGSALLAAASGIYGTLSGKSAKTAATEQSGKKSSSLLSVLLPLAAIVFLLLVVLAISVAMDHLMFEKGLIYSALMRSPAANELCWDLLWLAVGFALVGVVALLAWRAVNINRFSAHSIYRNRLIRAYLGASNPERAPNPFTGFDEGDNIEMKELWPAKEGPWQPFHVVNIALNVVNSNRLAWQERKAVSLTMTPLHCGSAADGLGLPRHERSMATGKAAASRSYRGRDLGRGRKPEHGLSLVAGRHVAAGAVQRAARLVARQSGQGRRRHIWRAGAVERDQAVHRRRCSGGRRTTAITCTSRTEGISRTWASTR
jgi:hypothetical protein